MARHYLKTWPAFFDPVRAGIKSFELRRNDRDFQVGDRLVLQEFDPAKEAYTGRELHRRVVYVMRGGGKDKPSRGLAMGYAILGLVEDDAEAVDMPRDLIEPERLAC